jgi:hypothetical protein
MTIFEYLSHVFEDRVDFAHDEIKVESHKDAQTIQTNETIKGSVRTGGPRSLQAFIYANDGKWYPQAAVTVDARWEPAYPWSVPVVFGDGHNDGKHQYYLFTVLDGETPVTEPVTNLPEGVKRSRIIALRKKVA